MIKEATAKPYTATVLRWGGGTDELQQVGQKLGVLGIMFEVKYRRHKDWNDGSGNYGDIYPEVVLYDNEFRPHTATYGKYIIVGPGYRNVRVISKVTYDEEFQS